MNNKTAIALAALTVIANGLIGHFFAPNGIMLTPVIITITTSLICFGTRNISLIILSMLTYLFIAANDILLKLYSGGLHDKVGQAWTHILLLIGLVPTLVILLVTALRIKKEALTNTIMAVILFLGLIAGHLQLFNTLGLGRYY